MSTGSVDLGQNFGALSSTFTSITLTGSSSGSITISVPAVTTTYAIVFPAAQGAAGTMLQNNGSGQLSWVSPSGLSLGAFDGQAPTANGLALVLNVLYAQSADATHPGMVNTTTQTFAGAKTFSTSVNSAFFSGTAANPASAGAIRLSNTELIEWRNAANSGNVTLSVDASDILQASGAFNAGGAITGSNLSGTNSGDVTLAAVGATPNANGASLSGQILNLQPANATFPGALLAADWTTFNNKQPAGNYTTYTPNQYGVVLSGVAYTMSVLAPDASTAKVLISGGASANPSWSLLTNTNLSGTAAISNSNLAAMAANTVKANITGGSATPTDAPFVSTNTVSSGVFRDSAGSFSANIITVNSEVIAGTGGAGFTSYASQSSPPSAPATGFSEFADSTGRFSWIRASDGFIRTWDATLTGNRVYTFPDASGTVVLDTATQTLTNKRITPRVGTVASSATPTINTDNVDCFSITALAANITSFTTNLSGTPTAFQRLTIRILDNGTARTITWGASFVARGTPLPTTTVISKYLYVGFLWNEVASVWDCVAYDQEA